MKCGNARMRTQKDKTLRELGNGVIGVTMGHGLGDHDDMTLARRIWKWHDAWTVRFAVSDLSTECFHQLVTAVYKSLKNEKNDETALKVPPNHANADAHAGCLWKNDFLLHLQRTGQFLFFDFLPFHAPLVPFVPPNCLLASLSSFICISFFTTVSTASSKTSCTPAISLLLHSM